MQASSDACLEIVLSTLDYPNPCFCYHDEWLVGGNRSKLTLAKIELNNECAAGTGVSYSDRNNTLRSI